MIRALTNCPSATKEGFRKPGLHCATAGADGGMCPHVDLVYHDKETDKALIKCLYPNLREKPEGPGARDEMSHL